MASSSRQMGGPGAVEDGGEDLAVAAQVPLEGEPEPRRPEARVALDVPIVVHVHLPVWVAALAGYHHSGRTISCR